VPERHIFPPSLPPSLPLRSARPCLDKSSERKTVLTRASLAARGLLVTLPLDSPPRPEERGREEGKEGGEARGHLSPLVKTGEGHLYTFSLPSSSSPFVLKRYHKHAAGR